MEGERGRPADQQIAMGASVNSIMVNILLVLFKLAAGITAHSGAMVSDAVHSAADVFSAVSVIEGQQIAGRQEQYGHGKIKCAAWLILAVLLGFTGVGIGLSGLGKVVSGDYRMMEAPGLLALSVAAISVLVKEIMFRYTKAVAKKMDSSALMADAWHQRSEAFSSVISFIGIFGARMGWPVLDPAASVVICVFIIRAAFDMVMDSIFYQ